MTKAINIDPLFEAKTPQEFKKKLNDSIFGNLLVGVIGYILGKRTGMKITGRRENVKAFEDAIDNAKKNIKKGVWGDMPEEEVNKLIKKYDVKIQKK